MGINVSGKGFLRFVKVVSPKLTVASLSFGKGKYAPVKFFNDFIGVQDGDYIEFEGYCDYDDYSKKLVINIKEFTKKEFQKREKGFTPKKEVDYPTSKTYSKGEEDLPF